MQVNAIGFLPYIGKGFNFLLLSWMYAYYCFEYVMNVYLLFNVLLSVVYIIANLASHLGTNGIFRKWVWTRGWTSLNLTGPFLLVLVIHTYSCFI